MKRTKTQKKKILMLMLFITISVAVLSTTVSAESMVESGTLNAQWAGLLIALGIIGAILIGWKGEGKNWAIVLVIVFVLLAIIGICAFIDFGLSGTTTATTTTTTPDVSWEVTINSAGTDNNYNDAGNTFTTMIYVNKTSGTILDSGNASYTDPVFNWTVKPHQEVGVTTTTQQATGLLKVSNPDYTFSDADATDTLYLFSGSGTAGKKDVTWTADGATNEETTYVTVTFGGSEWVTLEPEYRDSAIKYLDTGDSLSWTIEVCGESYTATLTVVNAWGTI